MNATKERATPEDCKAAYDNWLVTATDRLRSDLLRSNVRPMSPQESRNLIFCTMGERNGTEVPQDIQKAFTFQVFNMRANSLDLKITPWAAVMVASLCDSPGKAVMYAHILAHRAREQKLELFTLMDVVTTFPNGFPKEDILNEVWDSQKGFALGLEGVDNLLDLIRVK